MRYVSLLASSPLRTVEKLHAGGWLRFYFQISGIASNGNLYGERIRIVTFDRHGHSSSQYAANLHYSSFLARLSSQSFVSSIENSGTLYLLPAIALLEHSNNKRN